MQRDQAIAARETALHIPHAAANDGLAKVGRSRSRIERQGLGAGRGCSFEVGREAQNVRERGQALSRAPDRRGTLCRRYGLRVTPALAQRQGHVEPGVGMVGTENENPFEAGHGDVVLFLPRRDDPEVVKGPDMSRVGRETSMVEGLGTVHIAGHHGGCRRCIGPTHGGGVDSFGRAQRARRLSPARPVHAVSPPPALVVAEHRRAGLRQACAARRDDGCRHGATRKGTAPDGRCLGRSLKDQPGVQHPADAD